MKFTKEELRIREKYLSGQKLNADELSVLSEWADQHEREGRPLTAANLRRGLTQNQQK